MARPIRVEFTDAVYHVTARGNERLNDLDSYVWSSHRFYAGRLKRPAVSWLCSEWLGYFGRTRRAAQAEYRRQIKQMFGEVVRSPWENLRPGGLVLGGDGLWAKACELIGAADGQEEICWQRRTEATEAARRAAALATSESDRRMSIWARVRLGGERMTKVATDFGYTDGERRASSGQTIGTTCANRQQVVTQDEDPRTPNVKWEWGQLLTLDNRIIVVCSSNIGPLISVKCQELTPYPSFSI